MGRKLISLALLACLVLLPVQIFAYGGDGGGEGGDSFTQTDIGFGPPLNFTPPDNVEFNIPDSHPNTGVAGSSITFPGSDIEGAYVKDSYDALERVGKGVVIAGKVAIIGIGFIGGVAGILAMAPATAATAGTIGALGLIAKVCGVTVLTTGALMQGAETYGESLDKGKSQDEAAKDGLTSGLAKGFIDHAINLNPAFGTIDKVKKATTGKGVGDDLQSGVTPNTPMKPTDA